MKKILLLGSGELGKELTISLKRIGCNVIACDSYENAPAMQVSDQYEVFNMLDSNKLNKVIKAHKPDFIVPEVEAIEIADALLMVVSPLIFKVPPSRTMSPSSHPSMQSSPFALILTPPGSLSCAFG